MKKVFSEILCFFLGHNFGEFYWRSYFGTDKKWDVKCTCTCCGEEVSGKLAEHFLDKELTNRKLR